MRRWPSWLLHTLVPLLGIGALVGVAVLQVFFVPVAVLLGLTLAGSLMVLSDRRHGRDASTSIAYRAPGEGMYDGASGAQSRLRYGFWQWMLGDPRQDPDDASHRFTPRQQVVAGTVTAIAVLVFTVGILGVLVFLIVLVSVMGWWGTADQVGPTFVMLICAAFLAFIAWVAGSWAAERRRRRRRREARARARARRAALAAAASPEERA